MYYLGTPNNVGQDPPLVVAEIDIQLNAKMRIVGEYAKLLRVVVTCAKL